MATTTPAGGVRVVQDGTQLLQVEVQNVLHYAKFLAPLATAAIIAFKTSYGQGSALFVVLTIAIGVAQAVAAWGLPASVTWYASAKFWGGAAATVAQAVLLIVGNTGSLGDLSALDWSNVALTAIGALGTVIIPNDVKSTIKFVPTTTAIADVTSLPPLAPIAPPVAPVVGTIVTDTPPAAS